MLVSICIPAFNAEKYIKECLNSLINQTYSELEIIIINDGSIDQTERIIKSYPDKRIKYFYQKNQGQCKAANEAFKHSSGDFIKFMDADDILSLNFIEEQLSLIHKYDNKIASASWGRFYNDDLSTFELNQESVWRNMKPIDWLVESLETNNNMMQCAIWLIPRKILLKSGLWNEELSLINDFDFFIRVLLTAEQILYSEKSILYYRSGIDSSLSNQKSSKSYLSAYKSVELGVNTILNFEKSSRTQKVCADTMQNWAYQFYPQDIDLYQKAKKMIKNLGGSNLKFQCGGYTKFMVNIVGWKLTKRIKYILKFGAN